MPPKSTSSDQLHFSDTAKSLGAFGSASDGDVLTWDAGTNTFRPEAPAGGGIGGSTGATDNRVLRADGTGGATVQNSAVAIDDSGNVTGVGSLDIGAADTTLSRLAAGVLAVEGVRLQPVSSASDPTVNDDSGDGYGIGQVWVNTTSDVAFILLDATAGAAVWGSLLPVNGLRITGVSGAPVMQLGLWLGNTFTPVGSAIAVTSSADANAFGATWSGANLTVNAATAVAGNNDSTAQRWSFQLPITIPSTTRQMTLGVSVSSFSEGARTASSVSSVGVSVGTSATAAVRTVAFIRPGSGTSYNVGTIGGSGTFSTLSGTATNIGVTGTATVGDTLNDSTLMVRYLTGNDPVGSDAISAAGSPGATIPTWVSLYVQVTGATTTTTWTLTGLTLSVRW